MRVFSRLPRSTATVGIARVMRMVMVVVGWWGGGHGGGGHLKLPELVKQFLSSPNKSEESFAAFIKSL